MIRENFNYESDQHFSISGESKKIKCPSIKWKGTTTPGGKGRVCYVLHKTTIYLTWSTVELKWLTTFGLSKLCCTLYLDLNREILRIYDLILTL